MGHQIHKVADKDLASLEERAKLLYEELSEHADARPTVIELAGSPKSGKSTTIDIVSHFFKRSKFKVWAPTEGASKRTPYHLRRDLVAFNAWSLNYAISELLIAYYNVDPQHLIILDRGPFDSLAWMSVLLGRGELSQSEYEAIEDFATLDKWANLISRVYLFTADPTISLERENAQKLIRKPGTAMNAEMLTALLQKYKEVSARIQKFDIQTIDTSRDTTPLSTSYQIADELLTLMNHVR